MSKRHENDNPQSSRQKFSKKLCFKYKQESMANKSLLVLLSANVVRERSLFMAGGGTEEKGVG